MMVYQKNPRSIKTTKRIIHTGTVNKGWSECMIQYLNKSLALLRAKNLALEALHLKRMRSMGLTSL